MDRLRVLFIPWWFPSAGEPILGLFTLNHFRAVSRFCETVVVHSRIDSERGGRAIRLESDGLENGLRTLRFTCRVSPVPGLSFLRFLRSIMIAARILRREGFAPDVINAHEFQAGVAARLLGLRLRRPVVVTEHWSGFLTGELTPRHLRLARFAFGGTVTAAPVSGLLAEGLAAAGIRERVTVIPNPVDTDIFSPDLPHEPWPGQERHFLFIGRLAAIKALPVLLEAFALVAGRHPEAFLDLVGDGPERAELERAVEAAGLTGRVVLHGARPPGETAGYIRRSSGVILASRRETFGAVLLEAMACGRPVIATRTCGAAPIVSEYGQIVLPPGESGPLAEALEQLLDRPAEIDHGMAEGIRAEYGFEAIGARYEALYRSLGK